MYFVVCSLIVCTSMYALYALFLCCVVAALDANKDIYNSSVATLSECYALGDLQRILKKGL